MMKFTFFLVALGSICPCALSRGAFMYVSDMDGIYAVSNTGIRTLFSTAVPSPAGLAVDTAGNVYAANFRGTGGYGTEVHKLTSSGSDSIFASGLRGPYDLALAPDGSLYVNNQGEGTIRKISSDGSSSAIIATFASLIYGITLDPAGNLYAASYSDNKVYKVSPSGTVSQFAVVSSPYAIEYGPGGNICVSSYTLPFSVKVFDTTGVLRHSIQGFLAYAMAFDTAGNLYCADNFNNITVVSPDFSSYTGFGTIGGSLNHPSGIATVPVPEPACLCAITFTAGALIRRPRSRTASRRKISKPAYGQIHSPP